MDADRAIDLASRLGFLFTPTQPSETLYRWTQSDPLPATLDVDIVSGHFTLKRQWQADPSLVVSKRFVSEQQTIMDAQGFLRGVSLLPADLNGPKKVSFWRAQGDRLVETISLSEADFVEVDMFRSNYQIVGEDKEVLAEYGFLHLTQKKELCRCYYQELVILSKNRLLRLDTTILRLITR